MTIESIRDYEYESGTHGTSAVISSGRTLNLEVQHDGVIIGWNGKPDIAKPDKFVELLDPTADDEVIIVHKQGKDVLVRPSLRGASLVSRIATLNNVSLVRVNKVATSMVWQGFREEDKPVISILSDSWEQATEIASRFDIPDAMEDFPALIERITKQRAE